MGIQKQDELFRAALEASPNGMIMINASGEIILANAQVEQTFGYKRSEIMGMSIDQLVPDEIKKEHPKLRSQFFKNPEPRKMGTGRELFGKRKDGTLVPVEIGLTPIQTSEGLCVVSSIVDITDRKKQEELFRAALEASPNGMIMINASGEIILANAQVEQTFGYKRGEIMGMSIDQLVPDEIKERHPGLRSQFFEKPEPRKMGTGRELFGKRKDGTLVPVEIGLTPIQTSEGLCVVSSIVDITERKKQKSEFENLQKLTHQIVNNARAIIHVKTMPDGRYLLANKEYESLLGNQLGEISGRTDYDLFSKEIADSIRKVDLEVFDSKEPVFIEDVIPSPDGSKHTYLSSKFPVKDESNQVYAVGCIATDATELKTIQSELKRSNKDLEEFAYVASHDLQTPLRHVASYTQLIESKISDQLDSETKEWLSYVTGGVARMKHLISDLLTYSKVRGSSIEEGKPVDLNALLSELNEIFENQIQETNGILQIDELPQIVGNSTQMKQLFQNLIGNALKFKKKDKAPRIEITTEANPSHWKFTVKDNGIGFDMHHADRIFHIFQRLHGKSEYGGTGIGLSVCKKIVEIHGGKIWVTSKPNEGTEFHFTIRKNK